MKLQRASVALRQQQHYDDDRVTAFMNLPHWPAARSGRPLLTNVMLFSTWQFIVTLKQAVRTKKRNPKSFHWANIVVPRFFISFLFSAFYFHCSNEFAFKFFLCRFTRLLLGKTFFRWSVIRRTFLNSPQKLFWVFYFFYFRWNDYRRRSVCAYWKGK